MMVLALQSNVAAAGLTEGRNYTMHSFRVGGAVSQTLAGTAVDALMEVVGWKTRGVAQRYVGPHPSVSGALKPSGDRSGASLNVEARYEAAIGLPLQAGFEEQFSAFK